MRKHCALVLLILSNPASASWITDCLLVGIASSEVKLIEPTDVGPAHWTFEFAVNEAVALKDSYNSVECIKMKGEQVTVDVQKRLFHRRPRQGQEYRIRYFMYENSCQGGGACSSAFFEIISERKVDKLLNADR